MGTKNGTTEWVRSKRSSRSENKYTLVESLYSFDKKLLVFLEFFHSFFMFFFMFFRNWLSFHSFHKTIYFENHEKKYEKSMNKPSVARKPTKNIFARRLQTFS